jgi:TctA family transporter
MPAAIFGIAVGFFPFISSAILSLRFTVRFLSRSHPAWITAVSLSPEARPADTENQPAPSAANLDQ